MPIHASPDTMPCGVIRPQDLPARVQPAPGNPAAAKQAAVDGGIESAPIRTGLSTADYLRDTHGKRSNDLKRSDYGRKAQSILSGTGACGMIRITVTPDSGRSRIEEPT